MYDAKVVDDFARRLSEKAKYLRAHEGELSRSSRLMAEAVIHDLEQSAEELRVTGEELRAQSDQLLFASRAVTAERARFFRLFDLAPDPFIVTDVHGGILEMNRAAASLLGMDRTAVQRKPLAAFVDQESTREFRAAVVRLARMEAVKDLTLRLRPRDGGQIPVSVRAAHLPPHDGEAARIIWTLRNQSDLESLDAARKDLARERESREVAEAKSEQARYIVQAAAELGADDDPNRVAARAARLAGRFADYATVELFGEDGALTLRGIYHRIAEQSKELQVRLGERLLDPSQGPELQRFLESAGSVFVAPGEALPELLDYHRNVPDALRPISLVVLPLSVQGQVAGVLRVIATSTSGAEHLRAWVHLLEAFGSYIGMALANATLLREADRRRVAAAESSRGRSRAMAGLSHELRTPLHSILGYTELLIDGVAEPLGEKSMRFVKAIRASALHQAELVDDILSIARPGRSRQFSPADLVVEDVVLECVAMISERARANGLRLLVEVPAGTRIFTDRAKLSQILINLLGNAVKFTQHGEVTIAVQDEGERITFEVCDTGCGIAPSELPHIFEPFWQGSAGELRGGREGTGLGLSLVRRLVGVLGGEVEVESREREGSTFRVVLPAVWSEAG
jgi:PAS domain S-box-containing protein